VRPIDELLQRVTTDRDELHVAWKREREEVERLTRERDSARDRILEYTDALVERDAEIASLTAALDERDVEAERVREQYDALATERDEARAEVERLKTRLARSMDWYQQRFNRLRQWVKDEVDPLSDEVARRYFSICANGTPSPHESADWRDTMHGLSLARDAAIRERDEARAEVERLEVACHAWAEDMREAARLCEQAGNEMPIDAVRRFVSSKAAIVDMLQDRLSESRAEVERLMHQLADATNESTHFQVMCKRETEEVERLTSELQRERKCLTETRRELASQYGMGFRRGAEAMREACARVADAHCVPGTRDVIRALPIPEEP
jgi:chromosome segregation ATPase